MAFQKNFQLEVLAVFWSQGLKEVTARAEQETVGKGQDLALELLAVQEAPAS
jgi:hypothetical protein